MPARRAVRRHGRADGARCGREPDAAAGVRVRRRRSGHSSAESRRHRRAAHADRVRDGAANAHERPAARLCLLARGQLGLAAAPCVQPDQPARLPRQRADVRALRRADGVSDPRCGGGRVGRDQEILRGRPRAAAARGPERQRPRGGRPRPAAGGNVAAGPAGDRGAQRDPRQPARPAAPRPHVVERLAARRGSDAVERPRGCVRGSGRVGPRRTCHQRLDSAPPRPSQSAIALAPGWSPTRPPHRSGAAPVLAGRSSRTANPT